MRNDTGDEGFVGFLCVLFIEDAVGFVAETGTAEEMRISTGAIEAIQNIVRIVPAVCRKKYIRNITTGDDGLVDESCILAPCIVIHTVFCVAGDLITVFKIFSPRHIIRFSDIFAVKDAI